MKTFETLYKRTRTGAIQFWSINAEAGTIEKISGQLGTLSPVNHHETCVGVNIGKSNETTPEQQAELQAESDWKKKKDSGYKSLKDLGLLVVGPTYKAYWENGNTRQIYNEIITPLLEEALPQFNSDAAGQCKPMLAKDWKKVKNIEYPQIIEPKLDGVRCLLIVRPDDDGEMPECTFLSRSGKEYTTLTHIARTIEADMDELPGEFILDGEIYSDELSFQEITAAVKKLSPNSQKLHFRAYDVVTNGGMSDRRKKLEALVSSISSNYIIAINWAYANDPEHVKEVHDYYVQAGYEGAMLRHPKGKYEQGFRSSHLLKVKEFQDEEFELDSLEYGQRGQEDLIAVCKTSEGKVFRAKIQGSREQKIKFEEQYQELYETEADFKLTVKFFGWTTDKLPRFPIGKALRVKGD